MGNPNKKHKRKHTTKSKWKYSILKDRYINVAKYSKRVSFAERNIIKRIVYKTKVYDDWEYVGVLSSEGYFKFVFK